MSFLVERVAGEGVGGVARGMGRFAVAWGGEGHLCTTRRGGASGISAIQRN